MDTLLEVLQHLGSYLLLPLWSMLSSDTTESINMSSARKSFFPLRHAAPIHTATITTRADLMLLYIRCSCVGMGGE